MWVITRLKNIDTMLHVGIRYARYIRNRTGYPLPISFPHLLQMMAPYLKRAVPRIRRDQAKISMS